MNSTIMVLSKLFVALKKISNPSGLTNRTQQMLRMPVSTASGRPETHAQLLSEAHVPLFHLRSQIRPDGSSFIHQILFIQASLAGPLTAIYRRLKDQLANVSSERSCFQCSPLGSNSGIIFHKMELFNRIFSANQLIHNI